MRVRLPGSGPLTDPIPDIDIAALAYDAARRALADALYDLFEHITAGAVPHSPLQSAERPAAPATGQAVGGNLSAEPTDGSGTAKAPPPADGPGILIHEGGRESGERVPRQANEPQAAPVATANPAPSVDEARAALEAAQDREDAVRGEAVMSALAQGTLQPATVKALGAKWPMPRGARFGDRDSSLMARLEHAGTVAVGRFCRVHNVGGEAM